MNVAPRYLGRGSWVAQRDPRVVILTVALTGITVIQIWDIRVVAVMLVAALLWYRAARIPWRQVRGSWMFVLIFLTFVILLNTILTSSETTAYDKATAHVLFVLPVIGTEISAEAISYGATQFLRFLTFASLGFTMAYAIAPADMGVSFARLGIPYKFAYAIDLTFRFIPSLASDFKETVDAQRVRGHEWDRGSRWRPVARLRRTVPLVVPLTMNAIINAEDTIDAMDLRSFGTGKRTWLRELVLDRTDKIVLAVLVVALVGFTALGFAGVTSKLWVLPFLLPA